MKILCISLIMATYSLNIGFAADRSDFEHQSSNGTSETKRLIKPSQAFHFAYQDYLKGHFGLALSQFQNFIADYPESSMVPKAYFYLGECYEQEGNLKEAARALTTLIEQYEMSRQVPAALFKLGKVMVKARKPQKAKAYWIKLIKDFRGTPEAKLASRDLNRIP
ncbi:tetratricopeptide repeat protein [Candidatus Nitronereus thalassa]|uniref:Tetratricopeptide repeat protein n=1 Tax=Candidatus Nitronereus thalassa TaxID=3020898 RepID=A0ABU3KB65_9BACT|nr:tetratricopeptide repeat protein [Candidatus Nitronereus thalassa]MDT7043651.1 tetratricopeptide repeat protein [Candidatus Nitronereus thalassa]